MFFASAISNKRSLALLALGHGAPLPPIGEPTVISQNNGQPPATFKHGTSETIRLWSPGGIGARVRLRTLFHISIWYDSPGFHENLLPCCDQRPVPCMSTRTQCRSKQRVSARFLGFCLEGSYSVNLKGPGSGNRPGRFPQLRPGGSPSCAPWVPPA